MKVSNCLEKIEWAMKYSSSVLMALEELLLNSKEHAKTTENRLRIISSIRIRAQMITLVVTDNGKGFSLANTLVNNLDWTSRQKRGKGLLAIRNNSTLLEGKDSTVVVHWYDVENAETNKYLFGDAEPAQRGEKAFSCETFEAKEKDGVGILSVKTSLFDNVSAIFALRYLMGLNLSQYKGYVLDLSKAENMDPSHGMQLIESFPEVVRTQMDRRGFKAAIVLNDRLMDMLTFYGVVDKIEKSGVVLCYSIEEALQGIIQVTH